MRDVMARMTDAYIAGLKPKTVGYEISDPQQRGLRVAVYPSGRRTFIVRYRFDGRSKKLSLQPGISLAAARKAASDALFKVSQGEDPSGERAAKRRSKETVLDIAGEFLT